jgi:uncharacterized protein involved in exopolysaccharide biosynthesis
MVLLLLALAAAALAVAALLLALAGRRREEALRRGQVSSDEGLETLHHRLEALEREVAAATASAGVAESLLLEKGIADEDEVLAARRRLGAPGGPPPRDDAVH